MNAWLTPIESAWQLAGWTMLHFLWIGAAVAAVGAVVRVALRRASPTLRYTTSLTTLAALTVAPVAIAAWLASIAPESRRDSATVGEFLRSQIRRGENSHAASRSDQAAPPIDLAVSPLPFASEPSGPLAPPPDALVGTPTPAAPRPLFDPTGPAKAESLLPLAAELLPWAWLVGAPLTFAWLTAGLVGSRRLQRASSPLVDGPIADACQRLQHVLGVTRRVALAVCEGLAQPVLVGIVKPTILLPASAVTGWTPEELEMALVHELAHVRRWDNLVNFLQRLIESLLFFHPAVWLVSRQVRRDREECCDAIVVAQTRQPEAYATLLVSIATKLRARPAAALAVASAMANHALAGRVRRILKLEDQPMWVSRRWLAALLAVALGLTTAIYGVAVAEPAADDDDTTADAANRDADEEESTDSKPRELTPEQREELLGLAEPGDVPAAVFVFPTTPEEIGRRLGELNSLGHNVRIANGDGFTVLFIKDLQPSTFRRPRRLAPHNVISVRVAGALDDSPINDSFTIEEEGTIALGPLYGRVAVEGLTVLEAEAAITTHLETILKQPLVQVTLLAREADKAGVNPLAYDDFPSEGPFTTSVPLQVRRLNAEIRHCQLLLARIEADLNDIEVMKEVARQHAENADAIEGLDAVIVQVQQRIADLVQRIARLLAQGKDDTDPELAMLDTERDSEAELLDALRARQRQENIPNEALQAAVTEYEVRKKYLEEKKAEIEERLAKAQARLAEQGGEPAADGEIDAGDGADAEEGADVDAVRELRAYPIGDIDLVNFQEWISLLAAHRHVEVGLADNGTMIVNATREEHEAIAALLNQSRTVPADVDAADGPQLLEALRSLEAQVDQIERGLNDIDEVEQQTLEENNPDEDTTLALMHDYETRKRFLELQKDRVENVMQAIKARLTELAERDAGAADVDAAARGETESFRAAAILEEELQFLSTESHDVQRELSELEIPRIPLDPRSTDRSFGPDDAEALPALQLYLDQFARLNRLSEQIQVLQARNEDRTQLRHLRAAREETEARLEAYRAAALRELQERSEALHVDDEVRAQVGEFIERLESLLRKNDRIAREIAVVQKRFEALTQWRPAEVDEETGDGGRGAAAREEESTDDGVNAQAELQDSLEQLRDVERRLAELEIPRIPLDPRADGPASPADPYADPTLQMHQQQLLALSQQIQALQAKSRNGGGSDLRLLQAAYEQTQTRMDAYRKAAERELETRVAELDEGEREELQARIDEYHAQLESLLKERTTLRRRIVALQTALSVAAESGEHDELTLRLFELFQESESNPAITETYEVNGSPDDFPDLWIDALEGWKTDPYGPQLQFEIERLDDGQRLRITAAQDAHVFFGALFTHLADAAKWHKEHRDGESVQQVGEVRYAVHSDAAEIIVRLWASTFAGSDDVDVEWHDASRSLELRAPRELHDMLKALRRSLPADATGLTALLPTPPLPLDAAVAEPDLGAEPAATLRLVTRFPVDIGEEDARRITLELRRQGYEAVGWNRDGASFLRILLPPGGKLVWETRVGPDGEPMKTCRVVFPQPAAGGGDAPARGEGESDVDAAEQSDRRGDLPPSAVEATNMGLEMLADGEYRNAIKAFNVAIAADATFAEAHIGKGDALKALGYFPEAAQSYSRALEIDAHLSAAYTGRGLCFLAVSPPDYDLALNDFQNALDLDRDNLVALSSVGRIYAENAEDPQRAIPFLSEALELDPHNAGVYRSRAQAYIRLGQYDLAENDAQRAAKLDPADPENKALLAALHVRRQQAAEESSARAEDDGDLDRYVAESTADGNDYRYDGKTFAEWQNLWRHELKIERRIEAIAALTAFGRKAYPQEAAEAILDVAGEYDFMHEGDEPEGDLKQSVVRAFSYGGVNGISPDVWLPILVERVRQADGAEQQRWRELLSTLLLAWGHSGREHLDLMMKLSEDEALGVQEGAQFVLARNADLSNPDVVRALRESLQGPKPSIGVLERRGFRDLDQIPEQFDVLFHADPQVQAAARAVVRRYNAKHEPWGDLYNRLVAVLDDPDRADDHLAAMRAIAALWPYLKEHWPADTDLLMRHHRALATGDEALVATTLWLLTKLNGDDANYVISRTKEMLPEEFTVERAKLARDAIKHLDAEERAIYGE